MLFIVNITWSWCKLWGSHMPLDTFSRPPPGSDEPALGSWLYEYVFGKSQSFWPKNKQPNNKLIELNCKSLWLVIHKYLVHLSNRKSIYAARRNGDREKKVHYRFPRVDSKPYKRDAHCKQSSCSSVPLISSTIEAMRLSKYVHFSDAFGFLCVILFCDRSRFMHWTLSIVKNWSISKVRNV